ncbi:MAG: carboxymuconolactone decarboxylase family protein [Alphaproteobacteria bacterium]
MTDTFPRLDFDASDPQVQALLKPVVERLGYYGDFFQVVCHLPDALVAFMDYTGTVKSPLTMRQNEVLALSTCTAAGGDYERIQHERLALKSGLDKDWIAELTGHASPKPSTLSEEDAALRDLAVAVVSRDGRAVGTEIDIVNLLLGPEKTVAVILQITRFQMISTLNKMFAMTLPVASIFDQAEG